MDFINNINSEFKSVLDSVKEEDRLGVHSFHRYYGKLIPAIPRAAIREFTNEGDVVFDPFVGSGTTAVETLYAERNFVGVEINPLSVLISNIKTANYDVKILNRLEKRIITLVENDEEPVTEEEKPFVVNREHWFKNFVQDDLIKIRRNIHTAVDFIDEEEQKKYEDFLLDVLSAIVKQVSNADTAHVFPGISKRMRRLEAEGKIDIHVLETFKRGLKKRIKYIEEFGQHKTSAIILEGNSSNIDLSKYKDSVDLVVTNPPYISSVRYAETLKLELYWMGICKTAKEYMELSNSMIGNDHISKKVYQEKHTTNYDFINEYIDKLFDIDPKQAEVVYEFFTLMEQVIKNINYVLKSGKKLVMKISDSKIRKIKVPTGKLLTQIALENGFKLVDYFDDKINENSRSLLTARNQLIEIATASLSDLMKEHPEHRAEAKQDLQLLNAQKMGEHEAEIEKIKNVFLAILRDIKKDIDNGEQPGEAVTAAMFQAMRDALAEQKQNPLSIDDVAAMVAGQIGQLTPMDEETADLFKQLAKKMMKGME